jgi:cytochrome oxidase Cu insertion factor (SCO1/SenC/PrrC family)
MYKLIHKVLNSGEEINQIKRLSDNAFIPFDSANTDFARFKNEIQGIGEEGESITPVELQDADGNTMTSEEVAEFITTLP